MSHKSKYKRDHKTKFIKGYNDVRPISLAVNAPKELLFFVSIFRNISLSIVQLKGMHREIIKISKAKIFGYHESIDTLPIYNWFKCEEGKLEYIHKRRFKSYPKFFSRIFRAMHFEFDKMDNSELREIAKLAYLKSLFVTATNPAQKAKFSNMYRSHEKALQTRANTERKKTNLNDLINIIEETNTQIGAIDVYKMTTSRFFSLYNRAIEKIKAKNRQHGNN